MVGWRGDHFKGWLIFKCVLATYCIYLQNNKERLWWNILINVNTIAQNSDNEPLSSIYLFIWLLTSLLTLCRSYHDSFMAKGNQYIQLVKFYTANCWPLVSTSQLFHFWFGVWTPDLRGGRRVCYHCTIVFPPPPPPPPPPEKYGNSCSCYSLSVLLIQLVKENH